MNFRKTKNKSPDKNSPATKKKHSYIVIGECLAGAAIVIACIGFASCSDPSPVVASATASPTASAKAVSLYDNAKDTALLDSSGKETDDKITVCSVKESDVNKSDLADWYFNHVAKDGYKYGILKFTDAPGKGVYADSTAIYEGDLKEDTATKGYTKPADTDLVYKVDSSKKTFTPANKEKSSAFPEAPASAETADTKEEKGDTAADTGSSKASSESGKSGNSGTSSSNASKPAGGSSASSSSGKSSSGSNKSSSGSGKTSCTPYTIHHDAVTHQETTYTTVHHDAVTTQQWVEESPAWDEQVPTGEYQYVCGVCHQTFSSDDALDQHFGTVHNWQGNYWSEPIYTSVHHEAKGHYETVVTQAAYDEQVPSGTKTVVDQAAWDEQGCK